MKKIFILYNRPLSGVQGINYVNNSFVEGNPYFNKKGYILDKIIGSDRIFDCKGAHSLSTIGNKTQSKVVATDGGMKNVIKKVLSNKLFIWSSLRVYFKCYMTAQKTIHNFRVLGESPDYIIFQDPQSALYYYREFPDSSAKTILILHCSEHPMEQDHSMFPGLYKCNIAVKLIQSHYDYVMNKVDKVVYLSQHAEKASVLPPSRKTYIFNGESDICNWELKDLHSPINLVCVGSMAWRKGQDYIIKALSVLPKDYLSNFHLHLVGNGPQLYELKQSVSLNNLTDYVTFWGSRNDVPDLLRDMDVFILPSESEGLPMSIIEALRQGLFIIASDTGAISEMIRPEFGKIVKRDGYEIAKVLIQCVDKNLINNHSRRSARNHFLNNFTLNKMIDGYCKLFETL